MLHPVKTSPSSVRSAAPTLNFEYGAYANFFASIARLISSSCFIKNFTLILKANKNIFKVEDKSNGIFEWMCFAMFETKLRSCYVYIVFGK